LDSITVRMTKCGFVCDHTRTHQKKLLLRPKDDP
jgi:hypothetical protein